MEKTATSGGADDCMDAGRYDYMEVIGRVEPGAETE